MKPIRWEASGSALLLLAALSAGPHALAAEPIIGLGTLPKEKIREVIAAHRSEIRSCYEAALSSAPNLAGKISVKFLISRDGLVTRVDVVANTAGSQPLETCVASRVQTWVFPPPLGGGIVWVTYPFIFRTAP